MRDASTTWGVGDYPLMAERLESAAELAVDRVQVSAGDRVLDLACGTGNAALLAARRGASVMGVDLEPRLLSQARARARAERVSVDWREADAAALPLSAAEFTVVLSIFGVMYVPDQAAAARELARVCAPGARLALAAWMPGSFMSAMGAAVAPYLPEPPTGAPPPARWGDEAGVAALLGTVGIELEEASPVSLLLEFSDRGEALEFLVRTAGHLLAERPRLEAAGRWAGLLAELGALIERRNDIDGENVSIRLDYLVAIGHRR